MQEKQDIRKSHIETIQSFDKDVRRNHDKIIVQRLSELNVVQRAQTLSVFKEDLSIDLREFIEWAKEQGKELFIFDGEEVCLTSFNGEKKMPNHIDCGITNCVAFDNNGHRIGMGFGERDKFLSDNVGFFKCEIMLAYSFQKVASVPHEEHDVKADLIITETELIKVDDEGFSI